MVGGGAVLVLAVLGFAGLAVQAIGQPANHPQIEMARSAVSRLDGGARPADVIPAARVDIARSTEPFLIVTDSNRGVLASSADLAGQAVLPPAGVFDSVVADGEDRVTWQPADGVRAWIVVDAYRGGFVIAGRSPSDGEQGAYLLLLWGSFAALGLAALAGVGLFVVRRADGL